MDSPAARIEVITPLIVCDLEPGTSAQPQIFEGKTINFMIFFSFLHLNLFQVMIIYHKKVILTNKNEQKVVFFFESKEKI